MFLTEISYYLNLPYLYNKNIKFLTVIIINYCIVQTIVQLAFITTQ